MAAPARRSQFKPKHYRAWIKVGSEALKFAIRLTIWITAVVTLLLSQDALAHTAALGSLFAVLKIK
jgi:hypothetical protein